jgi:hypothetical protein
VPPIHSDGIRVAAVIGSEPEMHTVASHLDGVGAHMSCSDSLGCEVHTCSSGVAGLVVDMGAFRMVEGADGDWGMHAGA